MLVPVLSPFSFARVVVVREKLTDGDYGLPIEKANEMITGQLKELMREDTVIPLNVQQPGSLGPVAVALFQGFNDQPLFNFFQRDTAGRNFRNFNRVAFS